MRAVPKRLTVLKVAFLCSLNTLAYAGDEEADSDGFEAEAEIEVQHASTRARGAGTSERTDKTDVSLDIALAYTIADHVSFETTLALEESDIDLDEVALEYLNTRFSFGWHYGDIDVCVCDSAFATEPLVQLGRWRGDRLFAALTSGEVVWRAGLLGVWKIEDESEVAKPSFRLALSRELDETGLFWRLAWQNRSPGSDADWAVNVPAGRHGDVYSVLVGWQDAQQHASAVWVNAQNDLSGERPRAYSLEYRRQIASGWSLGARLEEGARTANIPDHRYGALLQWNPSEALRVALTAERSELGRLADDPASRRIDAAYLTLNLNF